LNVRRCVSCPHPIAVPEQNLRAALRAIYAEPAARRFTMFVFLSMLAYSMQDLILEPFAGIVFGMTPAQSTSLSAVQHSGVLIGMIVAGVGGSAFSGRAAGELRGWITAGCVGSALALASLAIGAGFGPGWPLASNIAALGFANGLFAVSAIGMMMSLAGSGTGTQEGVRMRRCGRCQAIAFGLGGLTGALGVDLARRAESDGAGISNHLHDRGAAVHGVCGDGSAYRCTPCCDHLAGGRSMTQIDFDAIVVAAAHQEPRLRPILPPSATL